MNRKNNADNPLRAAGLVGVMGVDIAGCLFIGYWIGEWARDRFGGSIAWLLGGLVLGLAAGIISVVYLIKRMLEDSHD